MHNRFYQKLAGCLILVLGAGACTDSPAGPGADEFDPISTSQDVQVLKNAFDTPIYQSLQSLGGTFMIPGAALVSNGLQIVDRSTGADSDYGDIVHLSRTILSVFNSPQVVLIPEQYRGLTLVYNPDIGDYESDDTLTGAPADGIRFVLYAVNPVTGEIAVPLNPIGHADLIDESTETAGTVRIVVVSGITEFMNYTVSLTGTLLTPSVQILGFVTDGTTRVDIDLTNSIAVNIGGATITVDYLIGIPSREFSITAGLIVSVNAQDEEVNVMIDVEFTEGNDAVTITGEVANNVGALKITVNDHLLATVSIQGDAITVTGADGADLTPAQAAALEQIIDGFEEVFDSFDTFFDPVEFLFGGFDG